MEKDMPSMFGKLFRSNNIENDLDKELADLDKELNEEFKEISSIDEKELIEEENIENEVDKVDFKENEKSSDKKSIKNLFKKRAKYETSEDKQKKIKAKVTKISLVGILIGILILAIMAAIILFTRGSVKNVERTDAERNETKVVAFDTNGDNNYWKYQTNNKINQIEKKLNTIQDENQRELNKTKNEIQASLSEFAKDLQEQIINSNDQILRKVTSVEDGSKQREAEIKRYTDNIKQELKESFKDYSQSEVRPANIGKSVTFSSEQNMLPIPSRINTRNIGKKDNKPIVNIVKKEFVSPEITSAIEREKELEDTEVFSISMDDGVDYEKVFNDKFNADKNVSKPSLHIMTGFAEATLITGVSAPTFGEGVENPKPVLLSINSNLIIANDDVENLKDCLLIGTATGNMNSSRAEIIVNRLSCSATKDGKSYKIEQEASPLGWVVGEDGQYGMKGRLVDSAGKLLMRQLSVGFLQGVSMAFATPSIGVVPTGGSVPAVDGQSLQNGLNSGMGYGVGSALDSLAEYYKKMLDGMYPFVSVKAGRAVTVLFKGFQDTQITEYASIDVDIEDEDYYSIESEEIEIDYQGF